MHPNSNHRPESVHQSTAAGSTVRRRISKNPHRNTARPRTSSSSETRGTKVVGFRFSAERVELAQAHRDRLERIIEQELLRIEAEEQEALWKLAAAEMLSDPYDWEEAWVSASVADMGKSLKKA